MRNWFRFFSCASDTRIAHLFHLKRKALMRSLAGLLSSFRASLSFWLIISQTSQLKSERQMAARRGAAEEAGSDCRADRLPAPPSVGAHNLLGTAAGGEGTAGRSHQRGLWLAHYLLQLVSTPVILNMSLT